MFICYWLAIKQVYRPYTLYTQCTSNIFFELPLNKWLLFLNLCGEWFSLPA